jgi:hypothetical protein
MATQAKTAYGTQLLIGAAPGTLIPELTNLTDIGGQVTVVDVTAHDGSSGYGSKIPTFIDGGTVRATFNAVLSNAQQIALRTAMETRASTPFKAVFPTTGSPSASFNAFVTRWRIPGTPVGGALILESELTVDGPVIWS